MNIKEAKPARLGRIYSRLQRLKPCSSSCASACRPCRKPPGSTDGAGALPLGIAAIDAALGGGLARGALHEIAAVSEAHLAAATGFALGLAARGQARVLWIAEDMALAESGAPYGPGLDAFGLAPERLLTVSAARPRDLLWAMEEALRCRAFGAVIGELRHGEIDMVALRRLSLAAAESGALALLLRAAPMGDASTAATRWIVGAAPSLGMKMRVSPRSSCATAAARSAHGFSNGVTAMSASCSQRLLSLWLRRLSTDRIARSRDSFLSLPCKGRVDASVSERPGGVSHAASSPTRPASPATLPLRGRDEALVITGKRGNAELIVAVDEAAERLGLHTGLALAQARAMHPALQAIEEDAEADAALLENIADWCLRYTPLVAVDTPDGLLLDIGGCAHLYGGEEALVADLGERIAQAGFTYTIAIAGTIGAAWAAAHYGSRRAMPAARSAHCWRRCRFPHCGFPPRPSQRWRASGSSASAISSICRAAP